MMLDGYMMIQIALFMAHAYKGMTKISAKAIMPVAAVKPRITNDPHCESLEEYPL